MFRFAIRIIESWSHRPLPLRISVCVAVITLAFWNFRNHLTAEVLKVHSAFSTLDLSSFFIFPLLAVVFCIYSFPKPIREDCFAFFTIGWWISFERWLRGRCVPDKKEQMEYASLAEAQGPFLPAKLEDSISLLLSAKLTAGVELIKHEDQLNWNKFHHMIYINVGLFASYWVVISNTGTGDDFVCFQSWVLLTIALLGIFVSFGFFLTLLSGLACLAGHKEIVSAVDLSIAGIENFSGDDPLSSLPCSAGNFNGSLFIGKKGPTRVMFRISPVVLITIWVVLSYCCLSGSLLQIIPADKTEAKVAYRLDDGTIALPKARPTLKHKKRIHA